jgi:hypothetical protein
LAEDLITAFSRFNAQAQVLETQTQSAALKASAHPFASPDGYALSSKFSKNISDFSTLATDLVIHLDAKGGPKDLRCIYRGMAEDAKLQLLALQNAKNAGAQAVILNEMSALFSDASAVTPKSRAQLADHHDEESGQCPAAPGQKIESLPGL